MSNQVPPTTPIGMPPQQHFPPPPQKKSNALTWILVGCGTIIILGAVASIAGGYFIWSKAKEAGLDPELMEKQPALAAAKMMAAFNPDIEIVSVDEEKGLITFKEKSSGKVMTISVDQARGGSWVFQEEGKPAITFEAGGEGSSASVEMKSEEGTAKFGAAADDKLPVWLPAYPGATPEANFSSTSKDGETGSFSFKTDDGIDRVVKFYEEALKQAGLKVTTNLMNEDGKLSGGMASAQDAAGRRNVYVSASASEEGTQVSVVFSSK